MNNITISYYCPHCNSFLSDILKMHENETTAKEQFKCWKCRKAHHITLEIIKIN
jgi:transposase-like protein